MDKLSRSPEKHFECGHALCWSERERERERERAFIFKRNGGCHLVLKSVDTSDFVVRFLRFDAIFGQE
jgi:hypothetical protein